MTDYQQQPGDPVDPAVRAAFHAASDAFADAFKAEHGTHQGCGAAWEASPEFKRFQQLLAEYGK